MSQRGVVRLAVADEAPGPRLRRAEDGCARCVIGRVVRAGSCPFHRVERPAGTLLMSEGEPPACVWYVSAGTILLSSTSAAGDETACSLRGVGAVIGLEALDQRPARHAAWTLSAATLCRIDAASFRPWVGDLNTPAGAVARLALEDVQRWQEERIAIAGHADARVLRFLLGRLRLEGSDRPLQIEQQLLARMLGMTPETLSRTLARLRAAGALAPGRRVRIADAALLARLADDEP